MSKSPQTILGWAWVQRLFAWSPDVAHIVLFVVFYGPGLAYTALATCLICLKEIRDKQILPKRPCKR